MFNHRHTPRRAPIRRHGTATNPRIARLVAAAATVAIGAATLTTTTGVASAEPTDTSTCPRWTAVLVPGTGETTPGADPGAAVGMLAPIGDGLRTRYGADIDVRSLPYAAAPAPYQQSESGGVQALSGALAGLCPTTQVVLAGSSQGEDIVVDVLSGIGHGRGPIPDSRFLAAGLLSDPNRDPRTPQLSQPVYGQGIAGPREDFGSLADRIRTVCAAGDLYCATSPETSPALAAVGRAFTGNTALLDDPAAASSSGVLDPASVARQVILVLGGLAEFTANLPSIGDNVARLPHAVLAGDIPGAHWISGELNNLFNPLVQVADEVDLRLVARALSLAAAADPSGWTAVAAQVVDIVARVDIGRIATNIGLAQEVAWRAVDRLAAGDPVGAGLELTGLAPVATDLAATAASALVGDGAGQLTGLAADLTARTDPATSAALSDMADLARQGGDAAEFFTSGVHQTGYDQGVRDVLDWLASRIDNT
ncbi:cutinase family protein [Nocardia cyriacigeorgica]|uniref:cutinase family protein n=1 Tax=Nocardia cyriacigeorgica TaxID=135487 RepID=UPI0018950C5D|nr:cutinase family protein [Nocardia cyriacigeorgica]MBF6477124.1 cutinase family protein [Nocardia cyriacigeorgica]